MTQPHPPVPDEARELFSRNDIRAVDVMLVDAWGFPRGKRFPVRALLDEGVMSIGAATFAGNADAFLDETPFISAASGYPDMVVVPDYTTLRVAGWADGLATVMGDCLDPATGRPIVMDARSMVRSTLAEYAELGYRVNLATELEFHLFDADWRPAWSEIGLYSLGVLQDRSDLLDAIVVALQRTGLEVENTSIEYSPGQAEVTQRYDEALAMLDKTVLFKHVVRQVARRYGYHASFMAKPASDLGGSGMHVHLSLQDAAGTNPFGASDDEHPLGSAALRRFVAGLLAHQLDLQAVTHPTINDYRRSVDYSFAPTQVTWGVDNRHAGVRCLPGRGAASRVEVRWASAGTNPYLVGQAYLQAGLDGLRSEHTLIPECIGDAYADPSWQRIASEPILALDRFTRSPLARRAFGDVFVETFRALQLNELALLARHVTDWERDRYRTRM